MKKIYTFLFTALFFNMMSAQNYHKCGVTTEDQKQMVRFVEEFNNGMHQVSESRSTEPFYVPVTFHLVAKNDGSGRIKTKFMLQQMAVLIDDFKKKGMYLYLDEASWNKIDKTSIYLNASSFENSIVGYKDPNAVNIFICENADTPGGVGTTLGYYSPSGDFVIIRINDVENTTSSLTHELGHFFSLPHTFYGWEGVFGIYNWQNGWDPDQFGGKVTMTTAPGSNVEVEVVNRDNCTTAADRICDTPVDYNFGFQAQECEWKKTVLDRNDDLIDPQENNFMGYFGDCNQYIYTQGQTDVMRANFESPERSHIRRDYIPDTTHIDSDNYTTLSPEKNSVTPFFNEVFLDWEDAPGASHYLLTLTNSDGTLEYVTDKSDLLVTDLEPNTFYFWEIYPFNEGYTKAETISSFFKTGNVSAVKETQLISKVNTYPNPVNAGQDVTISMDIAKNLDVNVSMTDVTGRVIYAQSTSMSAGFNTYTIPTHQMTSGLYIIRLETEDGAIVKKVLLK